MGVKQAKMSSECERKGNRMQTPELEKQVPVWLVRCQQTHAMQQVFGLNQTEVAQQQGRHRTRVVVDTTIWNYLSANPPMLEMARNNELGYDEALTMARQQRRQAQEQRHAVREAIDSNDPRVKLVDAILALFQPPGVPTPEQWQAQQARR